MSAEIQTSIRDAHKDLTRARILDAVIALMAGGSDEGLTVAEVAARAGVTERTVYRHFPTRDDLLRAVWPRMQALVGSTGFPKTAGAMIETPLRLFPAFDRHEGAVRASVYSKAGREVRLRANDDRQAAILGCVGEAYPDLSGPALLRLAAVLQLLGSAYAWTVMKEFWGLSGEESGRAASDAIAILLGRKAGPIHETSEEMTP